mmetsp:Transcript_58197/g.104160  ORF Transcript_58197/g.104160 Transcript_58197/m.104160 type:complete len:260 (-) Transcript_58197:39-818(-)
MCAASMQHRIKPASKCGDTFPTQAPSTCLEENTRVPTGLTPSMSKFEKSPTSVSRCTPVRCLTWYLMLVSGSTNPKISAPERQRARPWPWTAAFLATTVAMLIPKELCKRAVAAIPLAPGRKGSGQSSTTFDMTWVGSLLFRISIFSLSSELRFIRKLRPVSFTTSCGQRGVTCSSLSSRKKKKRQKTPTIAELSPTMKTSTMVFSAAQLYSIGSQKFTACCNNVKGPLTFMLLLPRKVPSKREIEFLVIITIGKPRAR